MACKSCSTGGCGTNGTGETSTAGCKNNGACSTGGCNKMNVFDWLSNMDTPSMERFGIIEVKFKGGRKDYYRNINGLELFTGDPVIVDVPNGHHMGTVSLQGELVRLQMKKKNVKDNDDIRVVYRKANEKDLEKNMQAVARDLPTMYRTREIVHELKINMKMSDVEFQADGTKATFYYSSEDRVDFRDLIKSLASEFKIRVEMKQISLRQEAGRLGGIGVCGRELCCSTWLTDFKNVNTSAARYQNLSLNPVKLSGQCGRLKCCLNYELETYMDALKGIPSVDAALQTQKGEAYLQKTDIFRRMMWFSYPKEEAWYPVPVERVKEIMELNKQGVKPFSFEVLTETLELENASNTPATLNSDLDKYDKYNKKKKLAQNPNQKNNNPRDSRDRRPTEANVAQTGVPQNKTEQRPNNPSQNNNPRPNNTGQTPRNQQNNQGQRPAQNNPKLNVTEPSEPKNQQVNQQNQRQDNRPQQGQPARPQNNPNQPKPQGQPQAKEVNNNEPRQDNRPQNPNKPQGNRPQPNNQRPNPNQNKPQNEVKLDTPAIPIISEGQVPTAVAIEGENTGQANNKKNKNKRYYKRK
jgi:cell fate regulator YaaT (PSP1 superfamily)